MVTVSPREFTIEEVLPFVGPRAPERVYEGFRVRMDSLRYQVFLRGTRCADCGVEGTVFLLQREESHAEQPPDRAHFNLYARTAKGLVLMTKDHVHPRSKGGLDRVENLRTMCFPCNKAKGATLPTPSA